MMVMVWELERTGGAKRTEGRGSATERRGQNSEERRWREAGSEAVEGGRVVSILFLMEWSLRW